jgi:hypothetical protein
MFNKKLLEEIMANQHTTHILLEEITKKCVEHSIKLEKFKEAMEVRLMAIQEAWHNRLNIHIMETENCFAHFLKKYKVIFAENTDKIPKKRGRPAKNKKGQIKND